MADTAALPSLMVYLFAKDVMRQSLRLLSVASASFVHTLIVVNSPRIFLKHSHKQVPRYRFSGKTKTQQKALSTVRGRAEKKRIKAILKDSFLASEQLFASQCPSSIIDCTLINDLESHSYSDSCYSRRDTPYIPTFGVP